MIVPFYCRKYVACCGRVRTMKELVAVNLESFLFSFLSVWNLPIHIGTMITVAR